MTSPPITRSRLPWALRPILPIGGPGRKSTAMAIARAGFRPARPATVRPGAAIPRPVIRLCALNTPCTSSSSSMPTAPRYAMQRMSTAPVLAATTRASCTRSPRALVTRTCAMWPRTFRECADMRLLTALVSVAALALGACSKAPEPASVATPPAATVTAPPVAAPAATEPAPVAAAKPAASAPVEESKLERVAPLPAAGQLPAGKCVAGVNYRPLVPAQPTDAAPGKVEVVEVFWYGCSHCYALDPFIESWRKTKPAYIEFKRVPVTWQAVHQSHAKLFYTLEALGKEEALHSAVFAEMHDNKNYMYMQGDDKETLSAQV